MPSTSLCRGIHLRSIGSDLELDIGLGWDGALVTCPHPQLAERSLRGKNIKYLRKLK